MTDPIQIAIVGAGPSGLVALKELLQQGLQATCFEAQPGIGGIFRFDSSASRPSVWESCHLVSSEFVTSFSDFFPGLDSPAPFQHRQLSHAEYIDYLNAYASRWDLWPHIELGSRVQSAVRTANNSWVVSTENSAGMQVKEFDALGICSGVHTRAFIPDFDGLAEFKGQILHSSSYRGPDSITGNRVLFIGVGESGADIVDEGSKGREAAFLSMRRSAFVLPRKLRGYPSDYFGTRLIYSLPGFFVRRSDALSLRVRSIFRTVAFPVRIGPLAALKISMWFSHLRNRRTDPGDKVRRRIMSMRGGVGATQFESFATKSDAFLNAIEEGRCELKPSVQSLANYEVTFSDGTSTQIDSLVLCTGFEPATVPYLDRQVTFSELYLRCFVPEFRETLCLIGFLRPALGAIPPLSEMQARLWAQVLAGNVELPSHDDMVSHAFAGQERQAEEFRLVHRRLPHQVDFSSYLDELAGMVGCKPTSRKLGYEIKPLIRVYLTPFSGVQYRLVGPSATPEDAKRLLRHAPMHGNTLRVLDLAISTLLSSFGMQSLRPQLTLDDLQKHALSNKRG